MGQCYPLSTLDRRVHFRYVYYNATDMSPVDNTSDLPEHLFLASVSNHSSHITTSGLVELNVGLASNRIYNVLYENVAYCMVAFLIPLTTLVVFNVRLVIQLRRSRQLRRTLRPVQFSRTITGDDQSRSRAGTVREGRGAPAADGGGGGSGCSGQDETNITLVMVVIIVVFIICELPASANQVSSNTRTASKSFPGYFLQDVK